METKSGSVPPSIIPKIHSFSHMWLRDHLEILQEPHLNIKYRPLELHEIEDAKALNEEFFPIQYTDSLYNSINISIFSIGAFLYHDYYEEGIIPLLVGIILFRIVPNPSNAYLRCTYFMQTTFSAYVITIGVLEVLRGRGIAKTLIKKCINTCRIQEPTPLYLSLHVAEYNEEAIPFYEKLNFELVETIESHYYIEGDFYGALHYIYYFEETKKPILTWKRLNSAAGRIFKFPGCFKIFS